MPIESIHVKGFQCHREITVALDPHLTVIVGPNDVGKSALLRALKWLCLNQYSGKQSGLVNWDCKTARVILTVDGHRIVRRQGKGVNHYKLDGQLFKAFGAGNVPDPVAQVLNVGAVNFQGQLEGPFWFTLSPGQVGKELNKIIDLQVIDQTLANISASVRKHRAEVSVSRQRLREAKEQHKILSYVPKLIKSVNNLQEKYDKVNSIREKRARIASYLADARKYALARQNAANANVARLNAMRIADKIMRSQARSTVLRELIDTAAQLRERLCQATSDARACRDALVRIPECPLCGNRLTQAT